MTQIEAIIQNSKLEADTILYDENNQTIDARGNVRIFRNGQLTTGSAFKFKVTTNHAAAGEPLISRKHCNGAFKNKCINITSASTSRNIVI